MRNKGHILLSHLVAYRGDHEDCVENTLQAFQRAVETGARYAECDIQFTRDLIPVVIHDDSLNRLCNSTLKVSELDCTELESICAPHFDLLRLSALLLWLGKQPDLTLFVEVKPHIRLRLSDQQIADRLVMTINQTLLSRIVLISQSGLILEACAKQLFCRLGWVHEGDDNPSDDLEITYIFIPYDKAEAIAAWQAKGLKVGVYTIHKSQQLKHLLAMGVDLIEVNHFARLLHEMP